MNLKIFKNLFLQVAGASFLVIAGQASAAEVVFTLDTSGSSSSLSLSGSVDPAGTIGSTPMTEQKNKPGSLVTQYSGSITIQWNSDLQFVSADFAAAVTNTYQPGLTNRTGFDDGNYGFKNTFGTFFFTVFELRGAVRDLEYDLSSGSLALTSGAFDASSISLFPRGSVSYQLFENETAPDPGTLVDLAVEDGQLRIVGNTGAGNGSIAVNGTSATLTLPVVFNIEDTTSDGDEIDFTISGTLTGTATLTEPPVDPTFYANFYQLFGADADPSFDFDDDGQNNKTEAAFGTNPADAGSLHVSSVQFFQVSDADTAGITFLAREGGSVSNGNYSASGYIYQPRSGSDPSMIETLMTEVVPAITEGLPPAPDGFVYKTFGLNGFPQRSFFKIDVL